MTSTNDTLVRCHAAALSSHSHPPRVSRVPRPSPRPACSSYAQDLEPPPFPHRTHPASPSHGPRLRGPAARALLPRNAHRSAQVHVARLHAALGALHLPAHARISSPARSLPHPQPHPMDVESALRRSTPFVSCTLRLATRPRVCLQGPGQKIAIYFKHEPSTPILSAPRPAPYALRPRAPLSPIRASLRTLSSAGRHADTASPSPAERPTCRAAASSPGLTRAPDPTSKPTPHAAHTAFAARPIERDRALAPRIAGARSSRRSGAAVLGLGSLCEPGRVPSIFDE
ncbi:hypothetical protein B0H15DRAFT_656630 [Mycena belliarum]|uniref:Uncharacterized protein n=1 Tax=Mycena belliarum TaxID=1033014 RepID=A0AAD6TQD8_9AGAR|nr:hypothetical protein B0H15DRAFT_656630 [Mycena belliae]